MKTLKCGKNEFFHYLMFMVLHMLWYKHNLVQTLMPKFWSHGNTPIRYVAILFLQTISNELFDVYCSCKEAKVVWEALIKKFYGLRCNKIKVRSWKFYNRQMSDVKEIKIQINEYKKLLEDLKVEDIALPEKFVVGVLIEKLPESWNDYKNNLKHKQTNFTIEEIITHVLIEDTNRKKSFKAKQAALNANLVQGQTQQQEKVW